MAKRINYKVFVDFPGLGETEVFPLNETIRYGWKKENDVWRKYLPTKLSFVNTKGTNPHAFDIMAALEMQPCGCHKLPMRVKLVCGADENTLFEGELFFIDGEWKFDICTVEIEPRTVDPFRCLFERWEIDKNILQLSPHVTLQISTANYETATCSEILSQSFDESIVEYALHNIPNESCLGDYDGGDWRVMLHELRELNGQHGGYVGETLYHTKWIREVFTGPGEPTGTGWTKVNDTLWTRPAILQGPSVHDGTTNEHSPHREWRATYWTYSIYPYKDEIDNGRRLSNVITQMFSDCSYPVRSDFFGLNPIGDHPYNSAYEYAKDWVHGVTVFSISDVVRTQAYSNAIKANINLKKLLEHFKAFFKVIMFFDEANGCYRLEHISFFQKNRVINLVKYRPDAIKGYNSYTYIKERIPEKQTFLFKWQTKDEDWDESDIVYPDCHDIGRIEETELDGIHTDFESLIGSEIEDIDFLKGIFLCAASEGEVRRGIGDISGEIKANAGLSWANIVKHLHRWDMPSCSALVNGQMSDFVTIAPKIKQTDFSAELCCTDIIELNPAVNAVRTGLGNGEINDVIEVDLSSGMADFNLVYRPPVVIEQIQELSIEIVVDPDDPELCTDFPVKVSLANDVPHGTVLSWYFGEDASPAMAVGVGPHEVLYSSDGDKEVTVTAHYFGQTVTDTVIVKMVICA